MKVSFVDIGVENSGVLVSFFSEDEGLLIDEKSQNDKEIKKLYEKLRKSSKKNKIEQNIVDLVQTGQTLKENGLKELEKISDITSRLIVNKSSFKSKYKEINEILRELKKHV